MKNIFFSRLVYKDPAGKPWDTGEKVVRHPSAGGFADWITQGGVQSDEVPEYAKTDRTQVALETLGTTVETGQDLKEEVVRPVTPKAKENLNIRTKNEIFGNRETQEWYLNNVREALEKMNGDDLYEFIRSHPKYQAKKDFEKWNEDFAKILGLNVKDIPEKFRGGTEQMTYRRITAAAQTHLVDFFHSKKCGDVFQITIRIPNPWIFIDGRMGPYTVSVLNDYWMIQYRPTSKKTPIPPGRSGVGGEYKPGSRSEQAYRAAIHYLDVQEGVGEVPPPEALGAPPAPIDTKPEEKKSPVEEKKETGINIVDSTDLPITHILENDHASLDLALVEVYETKAEKKEACANRVMNLLAQKQGVEINQIAFSKGDFVEVTADGNFTVYKGNRSFGLARIPRSGPFKIF